MKFCQKIIGKPKNFHEAKSFIQTFSGRRHKVYTGVTVLGPNSEVTTKYVISIVKFKKLSVREIEDYVSLGEWKNKSGGYSLQGAASVFIMFISGSYSSILGLPIYETYRSLLKFGYKTN